MEKHITGIRPAGMTPDEKKRSWNAIESHLTTHARPFSYILFFKRTQSKIVAGLLGILILSGGAATAYADNAKPGDLLFPIEVAKEKAQILLTRDEKKKEVLRVTFAKKRLAEVRELASLAEESEIKIETSTSTTPAESTTSPERATDTPKTISPDVVKKVERAKRGKEVALREVLATRALLRENDEESRSTVDSIISELNTVSVGDHRQEKEGHDKKSGRNSWRKKDRASTTTSVQVRATSTLNIKARDEKKREGTQKAEPRKQRTEERQDDRTEDHSKGEDEGSEKILTTIAVPRISTSTNATSTQNSCGKGGACSRADIALHNTRTDCYVYQSPGNKVYDVTQFISSGSSTSPGGDLMASHCGENIYDPFVLGVEGHIHSENAADNMLEQYYIGPLK